VRVIPGTYLARPQSDNSNPGAGYIRVAMVQDSETTAEALHRMVEVLSERKVSPSCQRSNASSLSSARSPIRSAKCSRAACAN
jgi:hypothetical protein